MGRFITKGMHSDTLRRMNVFQNGMARAARTYRVDIRCNRLYINTDSFTVNISVGSKKFAVTLPERGKVSIHYKQGEYVRHLDVCHAELYNLSFARGIAM